jgi:hypothetical protein
MMPHPIQPKQIVLIDAPPSRNEKTVSICLMFATIAAFAIMAPFARLPLPKISAFIPAYEAALSISDLLTAVLLFGQFARSGLRSLLVLACAYLFDVFIIVPHALSFPGVFGPSGVIGGGPQTTAWLYCFWHGGFALLVLVYAVLANGERAKQIHDVPAEINIAIALTAGAVLALTLLATLGHAVLPPVISGRTTRCLCRRVSAPLSVPSALRRWFCFGAGATPQP